MTNVEDRPTGSAARQAFDDAFATLSAFDPEPRRMPPATVFVPPVTTSSSAVLPPDDLVAAAGGIAEACRRLEAGETTVRALVEDALAAADRHQSTLNALAHLDADGARARADELDRSRAGGHPGGALFGIPVTVKDVIDVAHMPTRAGSAAYDELPLVDAVGVARWRAADAVVLGKAVTHEFALGVTTPQSRNPRDPSRIPGGSSGGSAICVAVGIGHGSLGTDTRASIRVPAALSGVVGFKPTFGRIPTDGVVPLSWSMDHVAPMARTVHDAALLLDVLLGGSTIASAVGHDVRGVRVGVPQAGFTGAEAAVTEAVERTIARLPSLGLEVLGVTRPDADDFDVANAAGMVVSRCEAASFHRHLRADRRHYWDEVAEQLELAMGIAAVDYLDAQRMRSALATGLLSIFDEVDVLVLPTTLAVAPLVSDFARFLYVLSRNAIPWSFVGFPALSVPAAVPEGSLPVGVQLVGPPGSEALLAAVGHAVEGLARG